MSLKNKISHFKTIKQKNIKETYKNKAKFNNLNYRNDIDILRSLSILLVVLYHYDFHFFQKGYLGVPIFFTISGYLITNSIVSYINNNKFTYTFFLNQRLRRILPAYIFILIITLFIGKQIILYDDTKLFLESFIPSLLFLSNYHFWQSINYFNHYTEYMPLIHTWSLSVEMQFYIFYALVFIFFKKNTIIIKCIIIITFFLSLFLDYYFASIKPVASFYLPITRVWEILFGCLIALFSTKNRNLYLNYIGYSLIFVTIFFLESFINSAFILKFIVIFATGLILVGGKKIVANSYFLKILIFTGLISYSLYLIHYPLISLYRHYFVLEPSFNIKILLLFLSYLISIFSYKYVETPFRKKNIDQKFFIRNKYFYNIFFLTIILFISLIINFNNNFKKSLPNIKDKSKEQISFDKCEYDPSINFQKLKIQECLFNKTINKIDFIILGDSHAQSISKNLTEKIYKNFKKNTLISTMPGCAPILGLKRMNDIEKNKNCKKFNKLNKEIIIQKNIKNIILLANWPSYTNRGMFNNGEGGIDKEFQIYEYKNKQNFQFFFKRQLEVFKDLKASIYLIFPIPEAGWDVKRLNDRMKSRNIEQEEISISFKKYLERNAEIHSIFEDINDENIEKIYSYKFFCLNFLKDRCVNKFQNKILYKDKDHLSQHGSEIFTDFVINNLVNSKNWDNAYKAK
jgi:peptidoglycan/LPS O-acetylase OafA/YrhL